MSAARPNPLAYPPRYVRSQAAWLYLAIGVVLLGLSVVQWGLRDKLSLYTPPHATPVSAKAKLLSDRERPVASRSIVLDAAPPPPTEQPTLRYPGVSYSGVGNPWVSLVLALACFAPGAARLRPLLSVRVTPATLFLPTFGNTALRPPPALL